ncbi:MAG: hypothetical protein FH762_09530 [Firmicutes bacterium]|nr:hypothetical protein [Bacillota bacterium]
MIIAVLIYFLDSEGKYSFIEVIKKGTGKTFRLFLALFAANLIALGFAFGFLLLSFMVLLFAVTIFKINYTLPGIFTLSSIIFFLTSIIYQLRFAFIPFLVVLENTDSFEAWNKSSRLVKVNSLEGKLFLTGMFLFLIAIMLIIVFSGFSFANIMNYKYLIRMLYEYWGVFYLIYNLFIYRFYNVNCRERI